MLVNVHVISSISTSFLLDLRCLSEIVDVNVICFRSSMQVKSTLFMGSVDRCRQRIVNDPSVKPGHEYFSIDTNGAPY